MVYIWRTVDDVGGVLEKLRLEDEIEISESASNEAF